MNDAIHKACQDFTDLINERIPKPLDKVDVLMVLALVQEAIELHDKEKTRMP